MAMAEPDGYSVSSNEVAAYRKAGKRTVYRLAANGEVPVFKVGGTWRFRSSEQDQWLAASNKMGPKGRK